MARYRFHGRFVSEARARQLSNLRGSSKYVTSELGSVRRAGYRSEKSLKRSVRYEEKKRALESLPPPPPPPLPSFPEIEPEEEDFSDIPGAEFLGDIPPEADRESVEAVVEEIFGGFEISPDYDDFESDVIELAMTDIEDDDKYKSKE